jgi:hypothetical protein
MTDLFYLQRPATILWAGSTDGLLFIDNVMPKSTLRIMKTSSKISFPGISLGTFGDFQSADKNF